MWMIDPALLCRKHLLGEHGELHKYRHTFDKQYRIEGRIAPVVQIEPASMAYRHDVLVQEMIARGYVHRSPYTQPDISYLPEDQQHVKVDPQQSLHDLCERCPECERRIHGRLHD